VHGDTVVRVPSKRSVRGGVTMRSMRSMRSMRGESGLAVRTLGCSLFGVSKVFLRHIAPPGPCPCGTETLSR
jgi:hypothetical protein